MKTHENCFKNKKNDISLKECMRKINHNYLQNQLDHPYHQADS